MVPIEYLSAFDRVDDLRGLTILVSKAWKGS